MKSTTKRDAGAFACDGLQYEITHCFACPRLVEWRERVAKEKVRRYVNQPYWGKPVPSFGDPTARLLIIGLAPAAHGGNRTGRMFTGDRSGDWLYRALFKAGFANQPASIQRGDGLSLRDCYISAVIHCAPPENKPLPQEINNCRPYLMRELEMLKRVRVVVALGRVAFDAAIRSIGLDDQSTIDESKPARRLARPKFAHGVECRLNGGASLIASFHPSQQNTFTGKLTEGMLDQVFMRAKSLIGD